MVCRIIAEKISLKMLQRHHHMTLNTLGDQETLVDAVGNRPGFFGPSPVAYLSLMSRRPAIKRSDIEDAMVNDRTLIRAGAFRGSLFLLTTGDYPLYFRAFYTLLRTTGMSQLLQAGVTEGVLKRFASHVREHSFELPKAAEQVIDLLYSGVAKRPEPDICRLILRKLCDFGVLVRASARGWKGNQFSYSPLQKWLPEMQLRPDNPEAARTEVIRRYLRCYGPVSIDDIAWWTGFPMAQIHRSVSHLRREVVRLQVEGHREEMICLKEMIEVYKQNNLEAGSILLLPPWDPFTLGWLNRRRVVDREWASFVFDNAGNATSVIVEDGVVIGVWQFRDSAINILEFHVFAPYVHRRKEVFRRAEEHAMMLVELSGAQAVNIFERALPKTLAERPPGSFLWPLNQEMVLKTSDKALLDSPMDRRGANTFRSKYLDSDHMVRPLTA